MWRRLLILIALGLVSVGGLLWVTSPEPAAIEVAAGPGNPGQGAVLYRAGGCLSCHAPDEGSGREASLPSGGQPLKSPFGTFYAPNITPHPETGIGGWTQADFVNAMVAGTSPEGRHYFPAFPYASYRHMTAADLGDLFAYLQSLEPVEAEARSHDIPLGSLMRPFVGVWKAMAFSAPGHERTEGRSAAWNRGAYLVRGPGHCGECHTPRTFFFVMDEDRYLQGGPHPEGKGKVPSLIGLIERGEYADAAALKEAFEYGELFGYDGMSSGGMLHVQENLGKLPGEDLDAIVEYLVSLE